MNVLTREELADILDRVRQLRGNARPTDFLDVVKRHRDTVWNSLDAHKRTTDELTQREHRDWLRGERSTWDRHTDALKEIDDALTEITEAVEEQDADHSRRGVNKPDTGDRHSSQPVQRCAPLARDAKVFDHARDRGLFNGADEKRTDELSIGRFVRGLATGNWSGADAELRAMSEGSVALGGALVPTPLAARIIDLARNKARVMQAGATTFVLESLTEKVARQINDPTVSWRPEAALIAASDPTFEVVTFQARSLACIVKVSFEALEDAMNLDETVSNSLSQAIGVELDRVGLRGAGNLPTDANPEPAGVLNQTGVTITALGSGNGATPSWDSLSLANQAIATANGEPNAFIYAPRTAGSLARQKDGQQRYLDPPSDITGLARLDTNQIPTDLTVGTSTDCSEIYAGQWSDLWFGIRTELRIQHLQERYADTGQIGLLAWMRADVQLAHPAHFNVLTGVRP